MKKVIISACLLGDICRYDGKSKKVTEVVEFFSDCEIIPFCPEAPLFGTPREKISVVEINGKNRILKDETKEDVTELLENEIKSFMNKHPKIDSIVLKTKSPSCGFASTPILNTKRKKLYIGNGIAAELFLKKYKNVEIKSELDFK